MRQGDFWSGFAAGTAVGVLAGIGGALALRRASSGIDRHVLRLEKSINIGRPVDAVFSAWMGFEHLPGMIHFIEKVERFGTQSRWWVTLDGRKFQWDAQVTQVVPRQSVGWKSVSGPKHSGRISFAPVGEQTLVHVTMNYAPPVGGSMLPLDQHLESWIERGLREFKAALEGSEQAANF